MIVATELEWPIPKRPRSCRGRSSRSRARRAPRRPAPADLPKSLAIVLDLEIDEGGIMRYSDTGRASRRCARLGCRHSSGARCEGREPSPQPGLRRRPRGGRDRSEVRRRPRRTCGAPTGARSRDRGARLDRRRGREAVLNLARRQPLGPALTRGREALPRFSGSTSTRCPVPGQLRRVSSPAATNRQGSARRRSRGETWLPALLRDACAAALRSMRCSRTRRCPSTPRTPWSIRNKCVLCLTCVRSDAQVRPWESTPRTVGPTAAPSCTDQ